MFPSIKNSIAILFSVAFAISMIVPQNVNAQDTKKKKLIAEITETSVTTDDGWKIAMTYYQSDVGKDAPVVILLHGNKGNRLVWNIAFAKLLHKQGYAVVAVDLRKHGESRLSYEGTAEKTKKNSKLNKFDYSRMVTQDLEAVKDFLIKEHAEQRLNIKKLGIVGAEFSTVIALNYAVHDWMKKPYNDAPTLETRTPRGQDVRAVVLLSPVDSVPGMTTGKTLVFLRNPSFEISFLICAGGGDSKIKRSALKIEKKLDYNSKNEERIRKKIYAKIKLQGTNLLSNKMKVQTKDTLHVQMIRFFNKHLKSLDTPWQSRKSKFDN